MSSKQKFLLGAIILIAIFFRFYLIAQMPGGLFPDEAANGLDINLMQTGHLQPFYERGNGREAMFFYFIWGSVALFGKGPWQHDVVASLIGTLSVLMCFLVARSIFSLNVDPNNEAGKKRSVNLALLATFLMAVSTWHIVLSRTAFRAVQIPLFTSLTFYFLIKTYKSSNIKQRLCYSVLTGISFALGFYTYIAYRIMIPALAVVVLWPIFASFKQKTLSTEVKKYFLPVVLFVLAFIIFIFPIAKYFYGHPGSFVGRAGQVSIFNPSLYLVNGQQLTGRPAISVVLPVAWEVTKTQVMGFFTQGDLNWRSNISGVPFLSPLYSLFFGAGLVIVTFFGIWYFFAPLSKKRYWPYFLLTVWFWGMLLPVISTAEGIPHGLRSIGVIPAVFIISAWALYEFAQIIYKLHTKLWQHICYNYKDPQWIKDSHFTPSRMRLVNFGLKLIVVCFCLALVLQTYFLYFVYSYNDPTNFYYFRSDLTAVSNYLIERCNKEHTFLVLDKFSVQTTDYLTSDWHGDFNSPCNVPYSQVDPENSWQLTNLQPQDEVVFTQSSVFDTKKFKQYHPNAHLRMEQRNKFNQTIMAVYIIN